MKKGIGKKGDYRVMTILLLVLVIVIVLDIAWLVLNKSFSETKQEKEIIDSLKLGTEIEEFKIIDNQTAEVVVKRSSVDNLSSVVLVFYDSSGKNYSYENFNVYFNSSGSQKYQVKSNVIGVSDFSSITSVEVYYKYQISGTNKTSQKLDSKNKESSGGGGGSQPDNPVTPITPVLECTSDSSCSVDGWYNLTSFWNSSSICVENMIISQEYRNYSCNMTNNRCVYSINESRNVSSTFRNISSGLGDKFCISPNICNGNGSCTLEVSINCSDGIQNQDETDLDCGGSICNKCVFGKVCKISNDCLSGNCSVGICSEISGLEILSDYNYFWKFDNETNNEIFDEGRSNNGTLINGANIVSDSERGNVSSFDGINDYIQLQSSPTAGKSKITLSMWVKINESDIANTLYDEYYNKNRWVYSIRQDKWYTRSDVTSSAISMDMPILSVNNWSHLAFVYDSDNDFRGIYLNGVLVKSSNVSIGPINSTRDANAFRIGYACDGHNFSGGIDDVMFYESALTLEEITDIYNNQIYDSEPVIYVCGDGICLGNMTYVENCSICSQDCGECPIPAIPTCNDGIQNQDEEGIDCGGVCIQQCESSPIPTCNDGIQNQDEEGIDCGGVCPACVVIPICTLTNAYWNSSSVDIGENVLMSVDGENCEGENIYFEVWKQEILFGVDLLWPDKKIYDSVSAQWSAGYDGADYFEGTYYFKARLDDGNIISSREKQNGIVSVLGSCEITYADWVIV